MLRVEDVLARVGGDEFVVLLWVSDEDAAHVSRRLVEAVEAVAAAEPGAGHVSATTGWAAYPTDGSTLDALMNAADATVLERKRDRLIAARSC